MALFVNQNGRRTELQERIATELQERAKTQVQDPHDQPDGVNDSAFIKNTEHSTWMTAVWIILAIVAVIAAVVVLFVTAG